MVTKCVIQITGQGLKFLSPLTSPGLFGDDFLLAWQIEVLAQPWRKFLCSPRQFQRLTSDLGEACCRRLLKWSLTFVLLVFCIFLVTVVLLSPSGPSGFCLLLVDLKKCVRVCWLVISWSRPSIFSSVTIILWEYRVQGL
jgi:hypothetical protein